MLNSLFYYEYVEIILNELSYNDNINISYQNLEDSSRAILLSQNEISDYLSRNFGDRKIAIRNDFNKKDYFIGLFNSYFKEMQYNINMLFTALNSKYNPLHNYDKNSEIKTEKSGTETSTDRRTGTDSNTITNSETNSEQLNLISADNQSDFGNDSKSKLHTDSNNSTNSTTYNTSNTHTLDYIDRIDTMTEHTSGNIGVTTSAQMIQGEIGIRMKNYCYQLLDSFANYYFYYLGDD